MLERHDQQAEIHFARFVPVNGKWHVWVWLVLFLSLVIGAFAAQSYLDNGVIKIGVDLSKGGSITYLSLSGTTNNVVNSYDLGREIQQSYYSGPKPYQPSNTILNAGWANWPWNPIQSGDSFGKTSVTLTNYNDGHTLYLKCQPKQWALSNVVGQCTFESWISLTGNVAIVSNRLVNLRTDSATNQSTAFNQELPAVYTVGTLFRLFSYAGFAPFTSDALTNLPPTPPPWASWNATESWAALVNTTNWGLGIYNPGAIKFIGGFSGTTNTGGPADSSTGYIAPLQTEILDTNIIYTYTYHLILGTLTQIRNWVYAQPYRPDCNFIFDSDRQHWTLNTTDSGWPVTNHLHVSLNSGDPQILSPACAFAATNAPKLYIRATYQLANPANPKGQLFWGNNGSGITAAKSLTFPVLADGRIHTYEVNLAASNSYTGLITQLRFDPVTSGQSGDFVDVVAVSSSPFAGNEAVVPTLNARQTNGSSIVNFPALAGTNAGFVSNNLVYTLERRTNLAAGSWLGVAGCSNVLGNNTTKLFTNPPGSPAGFYRVKVQLQ